MAISGPGGGRDDEAEAFVDINITPLTDVILVLLVIFMVASTAVVETERARRTSPTDQSPPIGPVVGLAIDLPPSHRFDTVIGKAATVLRLGKNGALELEGRPVEDPGLPAALRRARAGQGEDVAGELVIAADGEANHAAVVGLIDRARDAGFRRVVIGTVADANDRAPTPR